MKSFDVFTWQGPTDGISRHQYEQHEKATACVRALPSLTLQGSVAHMAYAWEQYAQAHADRYGSNIGEDAVIGDAWLALGKSILGLLDGDTGGLDCGSLSHGITAAMRRHGFTDEEIGR